MAENQGIITIQSDFSVQQTIDNLEKRVVEKQMMVFARINHAAGAQKIGTDLRPTELLIFGSPQGGTPLMEVSQMIGLDLPLKALAWQDEAGINWLSINDLEYLAHRHQITDCPSVEKLNSALKNLAQVSAKAKN